MGYVNNAIDVHFPLLKYTHMCLTIGETMALYMDGWLLDEARAEGTVNGTSGGVLVLGQDQDKPGGGYSADYSLSGAVIDFHIFARVVRPSEVVDMAQCRAPPRDAFLTQASEWLLSNVTTSAMARQELCSEGSVFLMFMMLVRPYRVPKLCGRVHGYMPTVDDQQAMIKGLRTYFRLVNDFVKVYIPVFTGKLNGSDESFMSLKIIWDDGDYFDISYVPVGAKTYLYAMVCSIPQGTTFHLLGLTDRMEHLFDVNYVPYLENGTHFLRGVEKSFIRSSNNGWCLYRRKSPDIPVICTVMKSDFLPVGRRDWSTPSDNEPLLLTLSGCRANEFTCDSGQCISLSERCDSRRNCPDRSDEDNCALLRVDVEQRTSVTSVPFSPVEVRGTVQVTSLPEINLADNDFVAYLWMSLSWDDRRLTFFNLPPNSSKPGKLPINKLWVPMIGLHPLKTNGRPRTMNGEVWAECDGEADIYEVWEGAS